MRPVALHRGCLTSLALIMALPAFAQSVEVLFQDSAANATILRTMTVQAAAEEWR